MDRYKEVIEALKKLKFTFPKDGFDRIYNLGIDAAIQRVELMMEWEGTKIAEALDGNKS